jgi:hypothetical protein
MPISFYSQIHQGIKIDCKTFTYSSHDASFVEVCAILSVISQSIDRFFLILIVNNKSNLNLNILKNVTQVSPEDDFVYQLLLMEVRLIY